MADITIQEKQCSKCKAVKPVSDFHKHRGTRDGLHSQCRECANSNRTYIYKPHWKPITQTETRATSARFSAEEIATEEWREMADFPGHFISSLGRIESHVSTHHGFARPPRMLNPGLAINGYVQVNLSYKQRKVRKLLHALVLEAFVGPRPEGMEGCHNNGIRHDNRLSNLRWDTTKANHEDSVRHGTHTRAGLELGRKPRLHRYTPQQLRWVLAHRNEHSRRELSELSGVHWSTVRRILQGRFNPETLA